MQSRSERSWRCFELPQGRLELPQSGLELLSQILNFLKFLGSLKSLKLQVAGTRKITSETYVII